jgi:hypothetical protein
MDQVMSFITKFRNFSATTCSEIDHLEIRHAHNKKFNDPFFARRTTINRIDCIN